MNVKHSRPTTCMYRTFLSHLDKLDNYSVVMNKFTKKL